MSSCGHRSAPAGNVGLDRRATLTQSELSAKYSAVLVVASRTAAVSVKSPDPNMPSVDRRILGPTVSKLSSFHRLSLTSSIRVLHIQPVRSVISSTKQRACEGGQLLIL